MKAILELEFSFDLTELKEFLQEREVDFNDKIDLFNNIFDYFENFIENFKDFDNHNKRIEELAEIFLIENN